eukprot:6591227-Prymnesium_polylepis.1
MLRSGDLGLPRTPGFAGSGFTSGDEHPGKALGDDDASWACDGTSRKLWSTGEGQDWEGAWEEGSVLGLAADMVSGQVAFSKDGSWSGGGCGVVFTNVTIRAGVYPAVSPGDAWILGYFSDTSLV